ncbi:hypothetical protein CCYA_CCYA11G3187 [Cyanidiococcus yangmingshanensis]|nr:hypothetical protein CCYA_CCYA11G3187 [Cyanidiococcus yangmingshanensis]
MSVNIEVERKFVLSPELARRLVTVLESETRPFEARRLRSTRFTDVYYDTPATWALTLRDWWLRQRQAQWQLKVPWRDGPRASALDTYRELEQLAELEATLGWCPDTALRDGHIQPFAQIATERDTFQVTYRGHVLRIDLDRADFGYAVGEIEALVQDNEGEHGASKNAPATAVAVSSAEQTIRLFAKEMDIAEPAAAVRGKLAEYIRRFRSEHYAALVRHHILDAGDASPDNQLDLNPDENVL